MNNNNNSCIYNAHTSIQRGCSRRNILLLPRSLDTISKPHLQCTISTPREHSLPSCLSWRSGKYIHNISFTSYRVPIYTPGWRAAMWIKCLPEGQKCQALTGIEPATLWSRVKGSFYNIPQYLHEWWKSRAMLSNGPNEKSQILYFTSSPFDSYHYGSPHPFLPVYHTYT